MSDDTHPFPFFGAGGASYFESASVYLVFSREATQTERAAIRERVPPPLTETVRFVGPYLHVRSPELCHKAIAQHYEADEGDVDVPGERFFMAAPSRVRRFNEDIESWLRAAHAICPLLCAYRAEDVEAGGTELSEWHTWSLDHAGAVLERFDASIDDNTVGYHILTGILMYLADAGRAFPDRFDDVLEPGAGELAALRRGDGDTARAEFRARVARHAAALNRIAVDVDPLDEQQARALLEAGPVFLDAVEVPALLDAKLIEATATVEHSNEAEIVERVTNACRESPRVRKRLAIEAYTRVTHRQFEQALVLYDVLVTLPGTDAGALNNALYAVMDDKSGLGVQPTRARRYLKAALPHGPENPSIFYNAACVYMELEETSSVLENIAKAIAHGFHAPEKMREERMFAPIAETPEFRKLFD